MFSNIKFKVFKIFFFNYKIPNVWYFIKAIWQANKHNNLDTYSDKSLLYGSSRLTYAWGRILIHPDDASIWSSWYYFHFSTQIDLFFFRGHHHYFYSNADKLFNVFSAALGESAGIIFGCLRTQMNSDLKGWLTNSSNILLLLACCWNVCDI